MKVKNPDRVMRIFRVVATVAVVGLFYIVFTFFRLDWVTYDSVVRYWTVESMACQGQAAQPVIRFYKARNAEPDFPIHYNAGFHHYLAQRSASEGAVEIRRRVVGYLPEWDYAIIVAKSIEGKAVPDAWLMAPDDYKDCAFARVKDRDEPKKSTVIRLREE